MTIEYGGAGCVAACLCASTRGINSIIVLFTKIKEIYHVCFTDLWLLSRKKRKSKMYDKLSSIPDILGEIRPIHFIKRSNTTAFYYQIAFVGQRV